MLLNSVGYYNYIVIEVDMRLIYGVGVNDIEIKQAGCKYYKTWESMLQRCYSLLYHKRKPTYAECSVCDEWLVFSNFKTWMQTQDWQGKHLDKDLLHKGNKIYSPENCVFITQSLNNFLTHSHKQFVGTSWCDKTRKFRAICSNPITKQRECLGRFATQAEAHNVWKKRKHEIACQLAEEQENVMVREALLRVYKN